MSVRPEELAPAAVWREPEELSLFLVECPGDEGATEIEFAGPENERE
jgi:hypothetical protein